jgi:signal transduction histidine kinase
MNPFITTNTIRKLLAGLPTKLLAWPPRQGFVLASTVGILVVVLGAELLTPPLASLGAFAFIPVVIAGWLLPVRAASAVVGLALLVRIFGILGGVHPLTAVAETVMLVTIGFAAALAADRFRRWNQAQLRLRAQAAELAAAAERERIAQDITRSVIRTVFAVTLDLHAALSLSDEEVVQQKIQSANKKLDDEITRIRSAIFMSRAAEPGEIAGPTLTISARPSPAEAQASGPLEPHGATVAKVS